MSNLVSNLGWECPKCFAVMSPFTPTCRYCKPSNINAGNTIIKTQIIGQICTCGMTSANDCIVHTHKNIK